MLENDLQKKMVKELNSYCGCFFHRNHGGPHVRAGLPDIEGVYKGQYFGIEVKLPGKERNLTVIQQKTLDKINAAGGVGFMATTVDQVMEVVFNGSKRPQRGTRRKTPDR